MPRDAEGAEASDKLSAEMVKLTTPEHADTGFMTMLTTFGYPGLQVEIDGEYKSIKPLANNIIVNLG